MTNYQRAEIMCEWGMGCGMILGGIADYHTDEEVGPVLDSIHRTITNATMYILNICDILDEVDHIAECRNLKAEIRDSKVEQYMALIDEIKDTYARVMENCDEQIKSITWKAPDVKLVDCWHTILYSCHAYMCNMNVKELDATNDDDEPDTKSYNYPAVFTNASDGSYTVKFLNMDVTATGRNYDDARANAEKALKKYMDKLKDDEKPVPGVVGRIELGVHNIMAVIRYTPDGGKDVS